MKSISSTDDEAVIRLSSKSIAYFNDRSNDCDT